MRVLWWDLEHFWKSKFYPSSTPIMSLTGFVYQNKCWMKGSSYGMLWASKLGSVGGLYIKLFSHLQWVCFRVDTEELEGKQMGLDGVGDGKGKRGGHTMTRRLHLISLISSLPHYETPTSLVSPESYSQEASNGSCIMAWGWVPTKKIVGRIIAQYPACLNSPFLTLQMESQLSVPDLSLQSRN